MRFRTLSEVELFARLHGSPLQDAAWNERAPDAIAFAIEAAEKAQRERDERVAEAEAETEREREEHRVELQDERNASEETRKMLEQERREAESRAWNAERLAESLRLAAAGDVRNLASRVRDAEADVIDYQKRLETAARERDEARELLTEARQALSTAKRAPRKAPGSLSKDEADALRARCERAERETGAAWEAEEKAKKRAEAADREADALSTLVSSHEKTIAESERARLALVSEVATLRAKLAAERARNEELDKKAAALVRQVEANASAAEAGARAMECLDEARRAWRIVNQALKL